MKKLIFLFIMAFCIVSVADAQHYRDRNRDHHRRQHHHNQYDDDTDYVRKLIETDEDAKFYLSASVIGMKMGEIEDLQMSISPLGFGLGYRLNTDLQISLTGIMNNLYIPSYEDEYSYSEGYEIKGRSIEATVEKIFRYGEGYIELSGGIGYSNYPLSGLSGLYFSTHFKVGALFSSHFEWVFIDFMLAYSTAREYNWMFKMDFFCFRYRF